MNRRVEPEIETEIETGTEGEEIRLHPKLAQVMESRKVWAGVLGLVVTLALWWLGEIDGARAVEALTWVLGIFIGSVALEDGLTRFFGTLAAGRKR
jgi:hypothetical protein